MYTGPVLVLYSLPMINQMAPPNITVRPPIAVPVPHIKTTRLLSRAKTENLQKKLKLSQNKKNINDITAAPFSMFWLLLAVEKKTPKTRQM